MKTALAVVLVVGLGVASIAAPQVASTSEMRGMGSSTANSSSSMSGMGSSTSNSSSSMSGMGSSTSNSSSSMSGMGSSTANSSSSMSGMGSSTSNSSGSMPSMGSTTSNSSGSMSDMSGMPGMAQSMLDYFNAFRHIMPCGDASMNIPIMDPFRKSRVSLDINHELLALNGSIENMVIRGLSDFVIIDLVTNTSDHRTAWDIIFDNIQLLGNYNLYINADLAGYKFVVNLNGLMDIHVEDFRITTGTTVGKNAIGGMEVSDVDYYVQVGNIESYILDTQWSVAFNDFFNSYVRKTALLWIELNRAYIHDVLSAYVTSYRNTHLYNTTMMAHLESMVATSKIWNAIPCPASP